VAGKLLGDAIPVVSIVKDGSYSGLEVGDDPSIELDLIASIDHKLSMGKLSGFRDRGLGALRHDALTGAPQGDAQGGFSGIPVAKVGRNAPEGFADPHEFQIAAPI